MNYMTRKVNQMSFWMKMLFTVLNALKKNILMILLIYKCNVNSILNNTISQSIGGGIGQSRLLMWLLKKCHIGEVQVSSWPNKEWLIKNGVHIL